MEKLPLYIYFNDKNAGEKRHRYFMVNDESTAKWMQPAHILFTTWFFRFVQYVFLMIMKALTSMTTRAEIGWDEMVVGCCEMP
jgi:hypothetical protein